MGCLWWFWCGQQCRMQFPGASHLEFLGGYIARFHGIPNPCSIGRSQRYIESLRTVQFETRKEKHSYYRFSFIYIYWTSISISGFVFSSPDVHLCSYSSCSDGHRPLFLRPQRCVEDGSAERIQPQEAFGLPLRHSCPRHHGTYLIRSLHHWFFSSVVPDTVNFRFWSAGYSESLLRMGCSLNPPCTQRAFPCSRDRWVKVFSVPYCCACLLISHCIVLEKK